MSTLISGHMVTNALAPAFYPNLGYNPEKDFEPVGLIAVQPELLAVRKEPPANTLKEFIAYAKANESRLNKGLDEPAVQKRLTDHGAQIAEPERRGPKTLAELEHSEITQLTPILAAGK